MAPTFCRGGAVRFPCAEEPAVSRCGTICALCATGSGASRHPPARRPPRHPERRGARSARAAEHKGR
eukprot:1064427-Alexandrium_andersonii.AAC.1